MARKKKVGNTPKESKFIMHVNPNYKKPPKSEFELFLEELNTYSKETLIDLYVAIIRRDVELARCIQAQNTIIENRGLTTSTLLEIANVAMNTERADLDKEALLDVITLLTELVNRGE